MVDTGHPGRIPAAALGDRGDLRWSKTRDKAQRCKHLGMLLIKRLQRLERRLASFANHEMDADRQVLTEFPVLSSAMRGIHVALDRPRLHGRGATADRALDVVPHHKVEPARTG